MDGILSPKSIATGGANTPTHLSGGAKFNAHGTNNTVQTFYVAEIDRVRQNSKTIPSLKNRFKSVVQSAMGNVKINKDGNELFFSAPDCVKVRRRLDVNGLIELETEGHESMFKRTMAPLVERAFHEKRDVVIALGGHHGTSKSNVLHGETLDTTESGDVMPDRDKWGVVCFAIEQLLGLAHESPEEKCEITTTVTKIHHDHVADVIVSLSGLRLTKKDSPKTRQQYAKLLTLSQGVTLDVEEEMDGRFRVSDQLDCSIKQMDDFLHVINCCAAANTGKFVLNSLMNTKKANPAHYLLSIRVWRKEVSPIYVHFLELADVDWEGPREDTEHFRSVMASVSEIGSSLSKGDMLRVKSKVRENTLTRILFSTLNYNHSDFCYFGLSKFTHGMETLEYMAKISNQTIEIVLHGPDGEGDDDVDPELKEHVHNIQQQCDDLKTEVESLEDERKQLANKLRNGEESISRLQQQCSIVKKLASMSAAAGHQDNSVTPAGFSASGSSTGPVLTQAQEQQRRLLSLERDLAELKAEDKRRTDSSLAQIKHINSEMHRCANRTTSLKKEHATLTAQLATLQNSISEEQKNAEENMNAQLQHVIDSNHEDLERRNEEVRQASEMAFRSSQLREQREVIKEGEITSQLQEAAAALGDSIARENAEWRTEHDNLQKELEEATKQRLDLEAELLSVKRNHHLKIYQLDEESKEMTEYAHRVSKGLVQFENYNSTEAKKVVDFEKCNVVLYDTTALHDVAWFQKQCARMRAWLDDRDYPRPAAFVDIVNNKCTILPPQQKRGTLDGDGFITEHEAVGRTKKPQPDEQPSASSKQQQCVPTVRPTTAGTQRPSAVGRSRTQPNEKPKEDDKSAAGNNGDYAVSMLNHLERRNNDLSIVLQSRQRAAQKEAEKKMALRNTPKRPGTATVK